MSIFLIAIIAILAGLVMVAFCGKAGHPILVIVIWWVGVVLIVVGVVLIVVGLILLLTPVVVWINVQLRSMLAT